jgi:cytochrome c biogenesis protein CcmG/thiol:disulfide interchange protein DsbE
LGLAIGSNSMSLPGYNLIRTLLTILFLVCVVPAAPANELVLGARAPAAELVTLDGRHIATRDLSGHIVLLTFWATWCEPCQQELPLLSQYAVSHQRDGLVVLGFCLDDSEDLDKVRKLAKRLSFPVGLLEQSTAPGYGRIWHIPVSFIIDRKGILRYNGWQAKQPAWSEANLNQVLGPLLRKGHVKY